MSGLRRRKIISFVYFRIVYLDRLSFGCMMILPLTGEDATGVTPEEQVNPNSPLKNTTESNPHEDAGSTGACSLLNPISVDPHIDGVRHPIEV